MLPHTVSCLVFVCLRLFVCLSVCLFACLFAVATQDYHRRMLQLASSKWKELGAFGRKEFESKVIEDLPFAERRRMRLRGLRAPARRRANLPDAEQGNSHLPLQTPFGIGDALFPLSQQRFREAHQALSSLPACLLFCLSCLSP